MAKQDKGGQAPADKAKKGGEGKKADNKAGDGKKADAKKAGEGKKADKKDKKGEKKEPSRPAVPPRVRDRYRGEVVPALMKEFGYSSVMQVPRVSKITLNMGLGEAVANPNIIKTAQEELTQIAGQHAVVTRAKKSIANFKLRAGVPIGCFVTLRRERMWEFFDRLVSIAMPRVRDFKGISGKAFDGRGNYSMGIREQTIFPEVNYDKVDKVKGLNVTITTTAKTDEEGKALLRHLGMPFRN